VKNRAIFFCGLQYVKLLKFKIQNKVIDNYIG